jgi:hypothetical protein
LKEKIGQLQKLKEEKLKIQMQIQQKEREEREKENKKEVEINENQQEKTSPDAIPTEKEPELSDKELQREDEIRYSLYL